MGGPASGMVLTLIIVTDEAAQYDAVRAASQAGREHPSRVLAVITRKPKSESRLDAEIRVGETGPGRDHRACGCTARSASTRTRSSRRCSCPTCPWSPGGRTGAGGPRGAPAGRARPAPGDRLSRDGGRPGRCCVPLAKAYTPGDTDFGWTRATPWRSLIAATLDQHYPAAARGEVAAEPGQPDRRPDRGLAQPPAADPGPPRRLGRPRHHRGPLQRSRGQPRA